MADSSNGNAGSDMTDAAGSDTTAAGSDMADVVDELPDDLQPEAVTELYRIPDNSRRRIPGVLYIVIGAACAVAASLAPPGATLINDGVLWAGVALVLVGIYHLVAGRKQRFDERDALVAATAAVGFAVGHASAQLAWRGLLSRPTWRVLLYSAEEPPIRRGLVLVDGIDGEIVGQFVEENPEDWSD